MMLKYLKFRQPQNQTNSHNQINGMVKQFLSLFLPLTALVGTGLFTFYQIQTNVIRGEIASTERREVDVKATLFANHFSSIRADLMVLAKQHELRVILDPASNQETIREFRSSLTEEYLVVSQQKQQYDQIRFLDNSGQEVVRVNFNQGQPSIVSDERLQNQSQRYWFKDTLALPDGEIFISPLDLNIDFGKIQQPLKPMIRFGTPVFDAQGRKRGMVVLNDLAEAFLKDLSQENSQSSGNMLLLNAQGYWLKGTKPEDEWGFMYDHRRDRTFAKAFPQTWQQILKQKNGQFHTNEGLYTFTTIYPLVDIQRARSSTGSTRAFGSSQAQVAAESYSWKLVSHVPMVVLTQRSQAIRNQMLLLFLGLTGLIASGSWLFVQARIKGIQSEQEAKGLEQNLQDVHRNQAQLVQTEKMVSLGQLVAGIAHEINNPVNFIHGNLSHTDEYTQNLLNLIQLYQKHYPNPASEIQAETEAVDLGFVQEDLPKLLASMRMGANRIRQIVLSVRNFSRLDEADCKEVDIHEGLESTLLILQHRLKASPNRPAVEIIRAYGNLPPVECYPGQLNQVFMNILANAIDALEEVNAKRTYEEIQRNPSKITIGTSAIDSNCVEIAIADNGSGMPKHIQEKIFDPFFTTKPMGKGTGIGMSISYQVVAEKHGGKLKCFSTDGEGTEFVIQLPVQQQVVVQSKKPVAA
jgi:signal transduction histidine kinase